MLMCDWRITLRSPKIKFFDQSFASQGHVINYMFPASAVNPTLIVRDPCRIFTNFSAESAYAELNLIPDYQKYMFKVKIVKVCSTSPKVLAARKGTEYLTVDE